MREEGGGEGVEVGGRRENSWVGLGFSGKVWGNKGGTEGDETDLLHAFVLLLLGFEALAGGYGCLEVFGDWD